MQQENLPDAPPVTIATLPGNLSFATDGGSSPPRQGFFEGGEVVILFVRLDSGLWTGTQSHSSPLLALIIVHHHRGWNRD